MMLGLMLLTGCSSNRSVDTSLDSTQILETSDAANTTETPDAANTSETLDAENTTETSDSAEPDAAVTDTLDAESTGTTKALVVYFTRAENIGGTPDMDATSSASINLSGTDVTGNLKIMADYITNYTGADEFSILTVDPYPQGYRDTTDQAKTEQNNNDRPAISTHVENIDQYDIIFIGYPIWWGGLPMPVFTFLEEYDFSGKTIIPFSSNEGSGMGSGPSEIADTCPDATLLDGIAVRGSMVSESKNDIEIWIDGLALNIQN